MKIKRIIIVFVLIICLSISTFMFSACSLSLAHAHVWSEWEITVEPSCTVNGEKTRICLVDSKHKETQAIDPLGHDWGEWVMTSEPTESTVGTKTSVCNRDSSHIQTEDISATGTPDETDYPSLNGNHAIFRLDSDEWYEAYAGGWVYTSVEDDSFSSTQMIVPMTEPLPPPRILYRQRPDGSSKEQMPEYFGFYQYEYRDSWLYVISKHHSFFRMNLNGSEKQSLSSEIVTSFVMHGEWIYYKATYDYNLHRMKMDGSQDELIANECVSFVIDSDYIFMVEGPSYTNRRKMVRLDLDGQNKIYLIGEELLDSLSVHFVSDDYLYYYIDSNDYNKENKMLRMKFDGSDIQTIFEHEKNYSLQNIFHKDGWIYFNRTYNDNGYLESEICKVGIDGGDIEQISEAYCGGDSYFVSDHYMMTAEAIIYASYKADGDILLNWQYIDDYNSYNYLIGNFGSHYKGYFIHNNKIYIATSINPSDTYNLLWIDGYIYNYDDGWVYASSYRKFYKMRPNGSEKEEITYEDYFLKFYGVKNSEWIYYIDETQIDSGGDEVLSYYDLCRVRLDGTDKQILANDISNYYRNFIKEGFVLCGNWLYFVRPLCDGFELCRIKLDGSGEQTVITNLDSFYIESNYIFTTKKTWINTYTLFNTQLIRYNLDGSNAKILTEAQNMDYTLDFIYDGFLYYTSYTKNSGYYNFNRISIDGSNQSLVIENEFSPSTIHLKDGWMYYLYRYQDRTIADKLTYVTTIYKIRPDGTNRTVVRETMTYSSSHSSVLGESSFSIIDDSIYYSLRYETADGKSGLQFWKLSLDGELNLLYDSYGVEIVVGSFIHDGELYIVIWN